MKKVKAPAEKEGNAVGCLATALTQPSCQGVRSCESSDFLMGTDLNGAA